jgi:chaperonin GroES
VFCAIPIEKTGNRSRDHSDKDMKRKTEPNAGDGWARLPLTAEPTLPIQPLHDFVLVEPVAEQERSPGGIYIPDVAKDKPQRGTVIAVGPGRVLENGQTTAITVRAGDRVLFAKYGPHYVERDGDELMLIRESDLLAVLC